MPSTVPFDGITRIACSGSVHSLRSDDRSGRAPPSVLRPNRSHRPGPVLVRPRSPRRIRSVAILSSSLESRRVIVTVGSIRSDSSVAVPNPATRSFLVGRMTGRPTLSSRNTVPSDQDPTPSTHANEGSSRPGRARTTGTPAMSTRTVFITSNSSLLEPPIDLLSDRFDDERRQSSSVVAISSH